MMFRFQRLTWVALIMTVAVSAHAVEEFRCDTEIFVAAEKNPVQQTLTIFAGGVVYDFLLGKAEEITVYDVGRGQISLLDKTRKLRTTILTDDLLQVTAAYKINKAQSDLFKFCTDPAFEVTFADNTLNLAARQLSYRVTCVEPEHAGSEQQYRVFADWSAQLNGMRPGNLPPFPRLKLNESLAAERMLPQEIERTISTIHLTGRRTETIRSQHRFNWLLNSRDRERIEEVGDYLTTYKSASVEDYLGLTKKMARK
jgi:hypothetical protein